MGKISVLSKTSGSDELKRYFMGVLEISKSGNEFPINLDEVWQLVYPRKDHAVRELTKNFIENVDYQSLPKNGEQDAVNQWGGNNKVTYMLTVSCMEFFIARKVRAVFEVYRQVFHGVANGVIQVPKTFAEALRLAADQQERIESQQRQIEDLTPDAEYTRKVLTSKTTYTTTQIAKELGMGAVTLNKMLYAAGVQYKVRGQWLLYEKYQGKGYTVTTTVSFIQSDGSVGTRMQTEWTEAGRQFIHSLFSNSWVAA